MHIFHFERFWHSTGSTADLQNYLRAFFFEGRRQLRIALGETREEPRDGRLPPLTAADTMLERISATAAGFKRKPSASPVTAELSLENLAPVAPGRKNKKCSTQARMWG